MGLCRGAAQATEKTLRAVLAAIVSMAAGILGIDLQKVGGALITLGQKSSANSLPVVLSTEQQVILSALQTDLDGILAKLDVALSTRASEATLALIKTDLDNIYARFDVALSTRNSEATQLLIKTAIDTLNTTSDSILTQLQNAKDFEDSIWISKTTGTYYIRREIYAEGAGTTTIVWTDIAGTVVSAPTLSDIVQAGSASNIKITSTGWIAKNSGTGYTAGDRILEIIIYNSDTAITSVVWMNTSTNTVIAAPVISDLRSEYNDLLTTLNTSVQSVLTSVNTLNTNFGAQADAAASSDTGSFSFMAFVKRMLVKFASMDSRLALLLSETDFDTKIGSLTETAPATDTASSGLNGRLQRVAQNISAISKAEDSPHTSGDTGVPIWAVRNDAKATLTNNDGDYSPISVNKYGEVIFATEKPSRFDDLGANITLNIKSTLGVVFSLTCYNDNILPRYLQLHNTATTPGAGAAPVFTFLVPVKGQIVIGTDFFTDDGAEFTTGIAFAFSTTRNTYTAAAAADQTTIIHYL